MTPHDLDTLTTAIGRLEQRIHALEEWDDSRYHSLAIVCRQLVDLTDRVNDLETRDRIPTSDTLAVLDKHVTGLIDRVDDLTGCSLIPTFGNRPTRATAGSAGADLTADIDKPATIRPGVITTIPTGTSLAIPDDHVGLLTLRSSLGRQGLTIPNAPGIIDPDYRGEIKVLLTSLTGEHTIHPGERIAQLTIIRTTPVAYVDAGELNPTSRGTGGFGSTGK